MISAEITVHGNFLVRTAEEKVKILVETFLDIDLTVSERIDHSQSFSFIHETDHKRQ